MNRCLRVIMVCVLCTGMLALAMAQEKPATQYPPGTPEKFQKIQISPNPRVSVNAAWRTRPIGVDHPDIFKITQDFEGATYPPTGWALEFTGTQYWTRVTTASGYGVGTASSKFDFFNASALVTQSLVTSTFTATAAGDSLFFDYAHAYYNATSIDSLILERSSDGGTTWISVDRLFSSATPFLSLSTVSTTSNFTPTASQWGTKRYTLPVGTNKIRFKAISGFGNNLYIDNVKVGTVDPNDISAAAFINPLSGGGVAPNTAFTPSSSFQNIGSATQTNVSVKYEIRNSVPAVVYTSTKIIASIAPGATTTVTFDPAASGVPAGAYTLRSVVVTPDANSANDTLNGTLRAVAPLTGTKTIGGTSPDYATFTEAVTDLNLGGVGSGGVIFNVRPGSYAERFTVGPVAGSSASNTVLFKRQGGQVTVNGTGTVATNDPMILLSGCDYVTFDSIDVTDGGTTTANQVEYGYSITSSGGTDGANNNTIRNARILMGGGGLTPGFSEGVLMSNVATAASGTCNNNKFQNLVIDRSDRGIGVFAVLSAISDILYGDDNTEISGCRLGQNVTLGDSLTTTLGSALGIIVSANTNAKVFNNTLYALSSLNAGSTAAMIGISCQVTTGDFYNNRILGIRHAGTAATALAGGIQTGTGINGTARIYNNFISNITRGYTGAATATNTVYGVRPTNFTTGGNGINRIFYNSIYLKDSVTGGVGYSSAGVLLFAGGLPVEVRNNILVNNTSTSSPTAKSYAIVDANAARGFLTSNNNILYAGGTNGYIGLLGTATFQQTLANWKSGSGQDGSSATENPPFRNIATVPNDLHIDSTQATRAESGGSNVAGITTDIDGQTRVVATISTNVAPDIGADEFSGTPIDNVGPSVDYTPIAVTTSTGNQTLAVTIKDLVSGVDVRPGFKPRLYYKKNGGSNWTSPQVDSAGVRVGNVWTFTITASQLGGLVIGDSVYYYAAAADSSGNVTTNPAGGSGLPPGSVPPPSTNAYRVFGTISGTVTVGATGATFTSVKAAFDSINVSVATTNLTILINSTYAGEATFPASLNAVNYGAGGPFTITLKPNTGVNATISGSSATAIIKLNGADYVTIDGSNSGGTTRNLTIANTNIAASTVTIWLSSLGAGAGCTNNTIKNCNIAAGVRQDTAALFTVGIYGGGTGISQTNDGLDNDNNTFTNNAITKVRWGIYLRGGAANANDNNTINQNLIGPASFGIDAVGQAGISIQNQNLATVTLNEVRYVGGLFASTSGGADRLGIGVGTASWTTSNTLLSNSTITRNLIHDIAEERTFSAAGIAIGSSSTPSNNTIANNMIYNVAANGTAGDQAVGIGIGGGSGDVIVYNSIRMQKDTLDPTGTSACSVSAAGIRVAATTVANLTLKNNIVYVDFASRTATLKHYAVVAPATSFAWGTGGSNNNDYYINPARPQMVFGGIGTAVPYADVATLAGWRTQFTPPQDASSIDVMANFLSTTNLHIDSTIVTPINGGAAPIAGVTTDYDGQTRNATTPDIGADEFAPPSGPGLIGTYTVGATGNYTSLSAAVTDLLSRGVIGPVTFSLIDASYTDSAQIITSYPGQSVTNTVTFKPAATVTPRIFLTGGSAATNTYGVRMDSVVGIIWDGSNSGGTDRSMTIDCDTNTTVGRTPFFIRKGSRNVTLKNMIIKANRHSAGTIPSVVVIDNTGFASSGGQNNMTVANCQLMRGNHGIFQNAASGAVRDSNHTFTNNLIGGAASASLFDHLTAEGIRMTGNHNVVIQDNDINGIKAAGTVIGIAVRGANTAVTVNRNRIHNLVVTSGAFRPLGILVGNIIAVGPPVKTRAVISNNMLYDMHNFGAGASGRAFSGFVYNPTGGVNSPNGNGSRVEWYYNSMNIEYAAGEGGTANAAYSIDGNFAGTTDQPDSIIHFNNIYSIKRADTTSVRQFLILQETVPGNSRWFSNNNVYYNILGPNSTVFAQIPSPFPSGAAVFVPDLAAFRDSTRLDSASVFGNPQFVSATDNHIRTNVPTPVESAGRPIAGITTDFDGDTRNATRPDIGADEGTFIPSGGIHDIGVLALARTSASDAPSAPSPAVAEQASGTSQDFGLVEFLEVILDQREREVSDFANTLDIPVSVASHSTRQATAEKTANDHPAEATQSVSSRAKASANGRNDASEVGSARGEALMADAVDESGITGVVPGATVLFEADADTARFRAIVRNYGTFPETTYQVRLAVDGTTITTLSNTRILGVAAQDTFAFAWTTGTPGTHTARAWTLLASDANRSNDTASTSFTITPAGGNTGLWTSIAASPNALSRSCAVYVKIADTGYVYQFGGGAGTQLNSVARYNTRTNTWTTAGLAPIPGAGVSAGAAVAIRDSNIYLFGHQGSVTVGNTWRYNVYTNTWTTLATMTKGITDAAVVKWRDSLVYVIGGGAGTFAANTTDTTQVYNIRTDSYSLGTFYPLKVGMAGYGIFKDTIIVAGGWNGTGAVANAYKGIINPSNPLQIIWTPIAAYPNGGVTRMASAYVSKGGGAGVIFAGGAIGGSLLTAKAYIWNFCTASWSPLDTFAVPRSNMKAAGAGDSVAYVIAGFTTVGVGTSDKFTFTNIDGNCNVPGPTPGWTTQTSGAAAALNSVKAVDQSTGWIAGNGGRVPRTVNTGNTWTNVGGGRIGVGDLYAIDALDANIAVTTSTPSTTTYMFRTTNAGVSWDTVLIQAGGFIDAIKMYNANTGIALGDPVGGRWVIMRTSNGGATWVRDTLAPVQVGTEAGSNNGMATFGTTHIWFASNSAPPKVYRSTNGGATWTSSTLPFSDTFVAGLAFNSTTHGVVSGNSGNAARTTDGGATWIATTIGGTGAAYAATSAGPSELFVTKGANVYRSTDRGATWAVSYTGAIGTMNHISFATAGSFTRGWAVTATGGIAAFYGGVTAVGEGNVAEIPQTFDLAQNYPNPFNPTTTIRYALPEAANVNLSIYNVLGQRVATLENDVHSTGVYNVTWNGRNEAGTQVASGIYFYRIEAKPVNGGATFTRLKKAMLLK